MLPVASMLALLLIPAAIVAALIWSSVRLERAATEVIRDTHGMAAASELEAALLRFQRASNLARVAPDATATRQKDRALAELRGLIPATEAHARTSAQARLHHELSQDIDEYVSERARLDASDADVDEIIRESRLSLEQALGTIRALGQLNTAMTLRAHSMALRLERLADLSSSMAIALVLLGVTAILIGVRRYIVDPLVDLHRAIQRFRRGDALVQAGGGGWRVITDVRDAFNTMARTLFGQREAQLAFLAGVAHDLRNPLAAVKMGIRVAEETTDEDRRARTLRMLDRQVDRLARMVEDLLSASRIEAGELVLERQSFDLRDAVREVVRVYAPTSSAHRLVLRFDERPVLVEADPLRVEQVVGNLVTNAIKYSPGGGRVLVAVRRRDDGWAVLEVSDQGIGMTPEQVQEAFEPFRRGASEVAPGAGLGLSVVRRIVDAHGGRIEVESAPRAGSTFRVLLPASGEAHAPTTTVRGAAPDS